MARWFNTAGVCVPDDHYMLPAARRLPDVRRLVDQKSYFVVHAPRQVGKTTAFLSLARELTAGGSYVSVLVSAIVGADLPVSTIEDVGDAERAILGSWREAALEQLPSDLQPPTWPDVAPGARIGAALAAWARAAPRPLVIFLDEADGLRDVLLSSVLRQLQEGYRNRPASFPWSMALIGLRDLSEYRSGAPEEPGRRGVPSPFNIIVESLTLRNFTEGEIAELYQQHTGETGQRFEPAAIARVYTLTEGQPWLVNALARQLVEVLVPDRSTAITETDVDRAKEILISRRDTHITSLSSRLREDRIRRIIAPMISGDLLGDIPEEDRHFALDLGLVREVEGGRLDIANPIYREVIARVLSGGPRATLPPISPTWLRPDGRLDPERLLDAFLAFWRRHGEPLLQAAPYHEVAPHLVLMAFLDRVANGGGSVDREYAIGRGRMDLCLRLGPDLLGIEIKVWRERRPDPRAEGLEQLDAYLAGLGASRGWLVIFDRRPGLPPVEERLSMDREQTPSGRDVAVIRA